jgi:hypothetical protein
MQTPKETQLGTIALEEREDFRINADYGMGRALPELCARTFL